MSRKVRQVLLNLFLVSLCIVIVMPFLLVVSVSFTDEMSIVEYGYRFWPKVFSTKAYEYIFHNATQLLNSYKVTFIFSMVSMVLSTLLQCMLAYPLARKGFRGKTIVSFYIYFTTLFSGGLVATYIMNTRYLHLGDTIWIYILPSLISPWYVFMIRTFFQGIPEEMIEAVIVDGGGEYTIFVRFIMPLSKPVIATIALFTFLGKWNEWYTAMLYINDQKLISLQYLLQRIMKNIEMLRSMQEAGVGELVSLKDIPSETARMAMAVVVAGPTLVIFPFFQKYFVKGMTVGSVKG